MGRGKNARNKARKSYYDFSLLFLVIFMLAFGLLMIYSTSSYNAAIEFGRSTYYLERQFKFSVIGIVCMIALSNVDYHFLVKLSLFAYIGSLLSIFLVLTPLGISANGATRWVSLGFMQFQPAELVKIGVIAFMALLINNYRQNLRTVKTTVQLFGICIPPAAALFFVTDNMSSALIVVAIAFLMLFIASPKYWHYFAVAGIGVLAIICFFQMDDGFRSDRLAAWKNPELYADTTGYQTLQSLYAIGSGGITGKGLGQSVQKLGYVPEAQNDMVYSIVCEELGLFGGIAVLLLFVLMIWRFLVIANNAEDLFGSMLVVGVMAQISVQVILNVAVVTNMLPNTGVTLPFISYGGTSLVILLCEIGVVLSVSKQIKMKS